MAGETKKSRQPKRPGMDQQCFLLLSAVKNAVEEMKEAFKTIDRKLNIIIMKEEEAAAILAEQTELLKKIQGETQMLIDKVNELIAEVEKLTEQQEEVSPELEAAISGVKDQVAVVDALVEDIPPPPGGEGGSGGTPKGNPPADGMSSIASHV